MHSLLKNIATKVLKGCHANNITYVWLLDGRVKAQRGTTGSITITIPIAKSTN